MATSNHVAISVVICDAWNASRLSGCLLFSHGRIKLIGIDTELKSHPWL
jgi:hypothetical protein